MRGILNFGLWIVDFGFWDLFGRHVPCNPKSAIQNPKFRINKRYNAH